MPPSDRQNTPLTIPPTEELEALQDDLIEFCLHTLERAKKADDDLQTVEAIERVKRVCAYLSSTGCRQVAVDSHITPNQLLNPNALMRLPKRAIVVAKSSAHQ
jgi:hypothetical protein